MAFDELRRHPDRVRVRVITDATVEGVIEVTFGPAVFVVSDEQDRLSGGDADRCGRTGRIDAELTRCPKCATELTTLQIEWSNLAAMLGGTVQSKRAMGTEALSLQVQMVAGAATR